MLYGDDIDCLSTTAMIERLHSQLSRMAMEIAGSLIGPTIGPLDISMMSDAAHLDRQALCGVLRL